MIQRLHPRTWVGHTTRPRALLEAILISVVSVAGLLGFNYGLSFFDVPLAVGILVGCGALLFSLRVRLPAGNWKAQLRDEMISLGLLMVVLGGCWSPAVFYLLAQDQRGALAILTTMLFAASLAAFVSIRTILRLWLLWDKLRRKRLLW